MHKKYSILPDREYKVIAPSVFNKDSQVEQLNRWYTKEEAEAQATNLAKQYNCEVLVVKAVMKVRVQTIIENI